MCFPAFAATTMAARPMVDRSSTDTEDDVPTKWLVERLRELATELLADPKTPWIGQRDPKQHICWLAADRLAAQPPAGVAQAQREIERLRTALELLTDELPEEMHTMDEPDEDWEVIVKMRAIAREALSPSDSRTTENAKDRQS